MCRRESGQRSWTRDLDSDTHLTTTWPRSPVSHSVKSSWTTLTWKRKEESAGSWVFEPYWKDVYWMASSLCLLETYNLFPCIASFKQAGSWENTRTALGNQEAAFNPLQPLPNPYPIPTNPPPPPPPPTPPLPIPQLVDAPSKPGDGLPVVSTCSSMGRPSPTECAVMAQPVSVKEGSIFQRAWQYRAVPIRLIQDEPHFLSTKPPSAEDDFHWWSSNGKKSLATRASNSSMCTKQSTLSLPSSKSTFSQPFNPFTAKRDQCQFSPAASPAIFHHTVWRISLLTTSHIHFFSGKVGRMYFWNLGVKGLNNILVENPSHIQRWTGRKVSGNRD